jgi:hypothetical protein
MNEGHAMAWVSFGLSLVGLVMAFFLNIPILFIILSIICLVLANADIMHSGKSIPSIIAIVISIALLALSGLAWYNNAQLINQLQGQYNYYNSGY